MGSNQAFRRLQHRFETSHGAVALYQPGILPFEGGIDSVSDSFVASATTRNSGGERDEGFMRLKPSLS